VGTINDDATQSRPLPGDELDCVFRFFRSVFQPPSCPCHQRSLMPDCCQPLWQAIDLIYTSDGVALISFVAYFGCRWASGFRVSSIHLPTNERPRGSRRVDPTGGIRYLSLRLAIRYQRKLCSFCPDLTKYLNFRFLFLATGPRGWVSMVSIRCIGVVNRRSIPLIGPSGWWRVPQLTAKYDLALDSIGANRSYGSTITGIFGGKTKSRSNIPIVFHTSNWLSVPS